MPVVIGKKPESSFDDPIGLLGDCHRRIEMFLGVLVRVSADLRGGSMSDEQRASWAKALIYFRDAAPKHTADEEESLFPRMKQCDDARVRALLPVLDELGADHLRADTLHSELDHLGSVWLAQGALVEADAMRLNDVLSQLRQLYERHIAVEDGQVFPVAAASITHQVKVEIGSEMARRRSAQSR